MKHIKISFILLAVFVWVPFIMEAQTISENETNSIITVEDPLIQVAYRKLPQSELLGGVSAINIEELLKYNYHTYSLDAMQGYIGGWNGASLWGMDDYLVLVDGVPRDANNVIPTEIEQITFLKGASAVVLYGSRAAKGVIYITTKKGKVEPFKVQVRANTGYNVSKSYPKFLGSAEYMTLYNEALSNDGLSPLYSEEDIYHHSVGVNPYRYPNVDFYSSEYLKKTYNRTDINTEMSGGTERARFYTNIGYYRVGNLFNFGEGKNDVTDRLNIRGNVDVSINDKIGAFVNANATFYNANSAITINESYWQAAATMRPNRVAPLIPISYIPENDLNSWSLIRNSSNIIDGKYFLSGTQSNMRNVIGDIYAAGRTKWTSRQFQFGTGLDFDLESVMRGLSFHTQFAVDYATSYNTTYNNTYAVFVPNWYNYDGEDVVSGITKLNNDQKSGTQTISGSSNRQTIAFSGHFNYEKIVNDVHNFSAILVAAAYQQTQSQQYHRISNANLGLQLGYNYKGKYFADLAASEVYSAKLPEGNRSALSPSITLGWRLKNENFLVNSSGVDDLVLSVSGSILHTDLDITDYYMYETNYTQSNGQWWGWYDGASERSTNSIRGSNKDLTFIKRKELSANLRTSLWDRKVTADVSYFINTMEGLIIEPFSIYPQYFFTYFPDASFMPYVNYNNNQRSGFDFNVNYNNQIGKLNFTLGLSGTYYNTEATKVGEINEYSYQNREGRPIDGIWGLRSAGLFQSQAEIDASPEQIFGGTIKPGDIKYVDQNGDNVIDEKDVVFLKRAGWFGAPFTTGVNLTARWNNLTLFALGTGGFGTYGMKNSPYFWVYGEGKYSEVVRDRWTEATKETATYPRLTTQSGNNNFRNSDYWLVKTDRFNLAKVQLTYEIPTNLLQNTFIDNISAYVSGSNLLTISKERELLEMNYGGSPQTRFYNIGVKAIF